MLIGRSFIVLILLCFAWGASPAGKIVYGVPARLSSLDPYLLSGIESYTVTGFVLEPLARIEPFTQELKPWLAKSWTIDKKNKLIKVKLRTGVEFHNGEIFSADDVRFTWKSYFDPKYKGDIWRAMWSDVEDVIVVDDETVEFKMKELKYQTFQNLMTALRILPKGHYEKVNHSQWSKLIFGSGPFKVERFEAGRALELAPNPDWWGWKTFGIPQAPGVLIKTVNDTRLADEMIAKGELDVFEIPSGQPPPMAGFKSYKSAFGRGFSLGVNFRLEPLQNAKLRKALVMLWNREKLNDKVYSSRMKPALDSFAPGTNYYPSGKPLAYDLEGSKKILKELGYGEADKLKLKVLVNSPEAERWVGLFQSDAAEAGVKILIEKVVDEAQWWQLVNQGKFELVAYDGSFSEKPHPSVWHSKAPYNSSGIHDEKLDKMLDELDAEFDPGKRRNLQKKLILFLREMVAEIPGLFSTESYFLVSPPVTLDASSPLQAWRWRKKDQQNTPK